jgi:hypothetical protein
MSTTTPVCGRCQEPLCDKDVRDQRGWCESCRTSGISPPGAASGPDIVPATGIEGREDPTFVDLSTVTTYVPSLRGLDADAAMPSIRHKGWPAQEFFALHLLSSPDGRWFARGGPAHSREEWQSLVRQGIATGQLSALTELAQVRPEQAAKILIRAGFELPPDLAAMVQVISTGSNSAGTPEPKAGAVGDAKVAVPEADRQAHEATGSQSPALGEPKQTASTSDPSPLIELANSIRRDHPRKRNVPNFLELIAHHDVVDFNTIADKAHGSEVDDNAIEKTVIKARKAIVEANLPFSICISDRRVLKKCLPG